MMIIKEKILISINFLYIAFCIGEACIKKFRITIKKVRFNNVPAYMSRISGAFIFCLLKK